MNDHGQGNCYECDKRIDEAHDYRVVVGHERIRRPASDTKAFHAPRRTTRLVCADCVRKRMRGVAPGQGALV